MNELEFLRRQLVTEAGHQAAVAAACAAALAPERDSPVDGEFLDACATYLARAGARALGRDSAHLALLRAAPAAGAEVAALLAELEATFAARRAALARLDAALAARPADAAAATDTAGRLGTALRDFLGQPAGLPPPRRHALERLVESRYGIADWRASSLVDADAILEERELWARVADCMPDDLSLAAAELGAAVPAIRRQEAAT